MIQAVWGFELAALGLFVGVPISIAGFFLGGRSHRWLGILGVLLNLAIFPVSMVAFEIMVLAMGLTINT